MKFLASCLVLLSLCSTAFAKDSAHILSGQTSSRVSASKPVYDDRYDTDFGLGIGYDRAFSGGFQFGGTLGAALFSGGSLVTLNVGPGYNFSPEDVENSFYTAFRFGVQTLHINEDATDTDTFLTLEIAKRFKLMENVSYVPGVTVQKYLGSNAADPSFSLELFRLSLVF